MRKQARLICGVGVAFLLLVSAVSNKAMAFNMDVKADLMAATCAISAGVGNATDNIIDMGDVDGDAVINWSYTSANTKAFNVHLTGCAGLTGGKTPALTISGAHTFPVGSHTNYFFRTSGTSEGMAIVICTTATCGLASNNEIPDIAQGNSRAYIAIPGATNATNPLAAAYEVPLGVTVGCGGCNQTSTRKAGTLEADITFNFVYH